jgi:hypothetical protein
MKIEMSVVDRLMRVRFRVSPQGVSLGDCGVGVRYGVRTPYGVDIFVFWRG